MACRSDLRMCITTILVLQLFVVVVYVVVIRSPWLQHIQVRNQTFTTMATRASPRVQLTTYMTSRPHEDQAETTHNVNNSKQTQSAGIKHGLNTADWMYTLQHKNYAFASNLNSWFPKSFNLSEVHYLRSSNLTMPYLSDNSANIACYKPGTNPTWDGMTSCRCTPGWQGVHCSIPPDVTYSSVSQYVGSITVRPSPRRVINALAFNMEFDLLEIRLHELDDVIDLFIIYESNYTLFGDRKPLRLLQRLTAGYLQEFHHKILYLYLGEFPQKTQHSGWYPEEYERMYIGREGVKHVLGLRPDDIFIYLDADEIPSRESLMFLRHHDGYPEPFGFSLRWSVFGYFWKQDTATQITAGCSIRMFRYIFGNNLQKLRANDYNGVRSETLKTYLKAGVSPFQQWILNEYGSTYSGWHCSWCLKPEDIRIKLISAVNADFPRWGNYPEKLKLDYIRKLIRTGTWFDDVTTFHNLVSNQTDSTFAPSYALQHSDKFGYLLDIAKK